MRVGLVRSGDARLAGRAKDWMRRLSPRRREWLSLLASCQLDPATVDDSQTPGPRDILIGGLPRSGTALLTAMVHRPPASIAVMEPWDALRLPPRDLFASVRTELATGSLARGRLDYAALEQREVVWTRDGSRTWRLDVAADPIVLIKFPTFWQYLDRIPDARFIMCVRHPAPVLRSFEATGGRLAQGLDYDVTFNRRVNHELLAATTDAASRRAMLYARVADAVADAEARENVLVVRYEDWGNRPEGLLQDIASFLGLDLTPPSVEIKRPPPVDMNGLCPLRDILRPAERLGYRL